MPARLSPRLLEIVAALPLEPGMRVLEIGCGPGAMAREMARRIGDGYVLGIDRSARAVAQAEAACREEIAAGRLGLRCVSAEDFVLAPGEAGYDLAVAVRIGALDGRHPAAGWAALARIAAALGPGGRLFVDGGKPVREVDPRAAADGTDAERGGPAQKTFMATVTREGTACFVPLDFDPRPVFGKVRAPVVVTLNGHRYRSTIAAMGGRFLLPLRRSNREAAGLEGGETLEVTVALDTGERVVEVPADLAAAMGPALRERWDGLSVSRRREWAEAVAAARRPETRARRIAAVLDGLRRVK